ncbi:hypothetical protein K3495_g1379 [Podosphaera aphanis]|nr:hypothetical protein K3495_g1379 [Podosphaera aphanis]
MFDDSWYNFAPELSKNNENSTIHPNNDTHESLVTQSSAIIDKPNPPDSNVKDTRSSHQSITPPQATSIRRPKSYNDFYDLFSSSKRETKTKCFGEVIQNPSTENETHISLNEYGDEFLNQRHQEYTLYLDQLALSERHLDNILEDTSSAIRIITELSESFKSVETETKNFQAQCDDLLSDKKRLMTLENQIGSHLQYYAYLEPLTKRLHNAGSTRTVRSDDLFDILLNLNTCIDFMDQHPSYRDSTFYKTRYLALLERSLKLIQSFISSTFKDITDEVIKELRSKDHNETSEYVLLYGKYESIQVRLGPSIEKLLQSENFIFGREGSGLNFPSYTFRYHELWGQIVDIYVKNREPVTGVISKNLKAFVAAEKPDTDFQAFARHAVQYILDICLNEKSLMMKFFHDGPLLAEYGTLPGWNKSSKFAERLEENYLSPLKTLHSFLYPYMSNGDLQLICNLVNWLEAMYLISTDGELDVETLKNDRAKISQAYLEKYLWESLDEFFLTAAKEIEHFKPSQEDLKFTTTPDAITDKLSSASDEENLFNAHSKVLVSNAYPTVRTAVKLLVLYNDGFSERPRTSDVLYEIVHQTTNSLQKAATLIKRNSGIMNAQLFLIKNLMLIENLFMTHEIPDSVRQAAEFDFTPIWDTISDLQDQKQLFNPLAYITPLVRGRLLPAVVDRVLDARKELERVLVQQITVFTKSWQHQLADKNPQKRSAARERLEELLNGVFDDGTTRAALWKMIQAES